MRLTADELQQLTGRLQASAQVRWFKEAFNVDVPRDCTGPIITRAAFERLVAASLGLDKTVQATVNIERPALVLNRP